MRGGRVGLGLAVVGLACACTAAGQSPGGRAGTWEHTTSASASGSPSSSAVSRSPAPSGASTRSTATQTEPLALTVDIHRPPLRLTGRQARAILTGDVTRWSQLGQPGGRLVVLRGASGLARVAEDENVLAVIPASKVTPLVQVATVAGVNPLTEPSRYLITRASAVERPIVTTLTVVGDIMLGRRVGAETPDRPGDALTPLSRRLAGADLTIGNLESTLSQAGPPEQGGDSFAADPDVLGPLTAAGFDLLTLANNHTGDFGDLALRQTLRRLAASPVKGVGAGINATDAWKPAILDHQGVRFGFVAFNAIGETPRATRSRAGVAEVRMQPRTGPLSKRDLHHVTTIVRRLNRDADVVVVLPHWGDQYTNQAVPDQSTVGAALLDAGADIVAGGHPHWVQGVDVHDGRLVVNSLGNFIFDMDFSSQTQQGVMLELVCWDDTIMSARFTPYVIGADFAPRLVHGPLADTILDRMWQTSDPPFAD